MVIFIFRCQFLLSRAWEVEMETRHSCVRDPRWKFFLFYVNRDWWNILPRVRAFDKKYWWLLSGSVTWDDRMLRFKMNCRRNSLFGNVIHFISSLVLWENDWSHEYCRWNHFLGTLWVPLWCTPILNTKLWGKYLSWQMILIKMPNSFRSRMQLPMWLPGGLWWGSGWGCDSWESGEGNEDCGYTLQKEHRDLAQLNGQRRSCPTGCFHFE